MAVAVLPEALPAQVVAVDAAAAPGVALLRGDQSPLPPGRLFQAIAPAGADLAAPRSAGGRAPSS